MSTPRERPNSEEILAGLKDFQRRTVDYAFERLWGEHDQTKRFLVADEVGLGKTMIAKGLIAKTVEHLWDIEDRIDIVYICSNTQIARQNIGRLNVVGGTELRHADRLTLLPQVIRELRSEKINFVSFTPGTSFEVGNQGGKFQERVMLYWMLVGAWGNDAVKARRWRRFFQATMSEKNFGWHLGQFDRRTLDPDLVVAFGEEIAAASGPEGGPLRDEIEACVAEFNYLRGDPDWRLSARRNRLLGTLRHLVARAAVDHLEPDLVILDEFQRFKDVLDGDGDGADLARAVFDHEKARVLLLSATPFKMYTLPDDPAGDDHYADFQRTVAFLADDERAERVRRDLRTMRDSAIAGGPTDEALDARDGVERELRRVMSRMERLASTPDRDGMLTEREMPGAVLDREDVRSWKTFDAVARHFDKNDVFEYWRSSPYPLNLMERNSYQVRRQLEAAIDRKDQALARLLESAPGLLSRDDIDNYRHIDPGNAKLRGLMADVLDRGAWKLAWLPPSLPYYEPGLAYADPELRRFTKRLIFSSWAVVPKAISVMMSYEAERRTVEHADMQGRTYDEVRATTAPLQFRPAGTTFALLYPSTTLARAGDPLQIARDVGAPMPMDRNWMIGIVRERVDALVARLGVRSEPGGAADSRWYWVAPALLDRFDDSVRGGELLSWMRRDTADDDAGSRMDVHLDLLGQLDGLEPGGDARELGLGAVPSDLAAVLTDLAIAGPGVVALRALSRVCGGAASLADPSVRGAAVQIAQGLRSLFNKPEIIVLLRAQDGEAYWRDVLHHGIDGCLQAVLDEYAHVLVESEGLQDASSHDRARSIAAVMAEALSIRTATNVVEHVTVEGGLAQLHPRRVGSHFAARYGRVQSDDKAVVREGAVRVAYNSPFRPFVLASTSVGQEGLDFHTYSHAIVHWNLPGNPVDLEQREGRVHRYKGHAVRKNVAAAHASAALDDLSDDPWSAVFAAAVESRSGADSEVTPFWVYPRDGGAAIERYVPAQPLSRELQHYRRLLRTVVTYRQLLGQPRQDDLLRAVGESASWMQIDLSARGGS
ncbi:helicase-related protein [Demequina sp. SYSU T00039]|uniref:Helicase-related protein n=1 Tax=Demequina lignilytica TaxID=3051663 RepID=A0AAW7M486_9MICO|nr:MULTISPECIES: helicase-related protein [unclassified Demequina]MDN4477305.1 helicase-related protein [Demequina sp. SYSU T00039-1]MDN4487478.1 helicase-related protein [Demequina sp. SYSU T00039]